MRRHALGIFSLALLISGAVLLWQNGWNDSSTSMTASVCMRAGLTLGAIWLAFPQLRALLKRVPAWLMACIAVALIVLVARPTAAVYLLPLVGVVALVQFVTWMFKPYPSKKGNRKTAEEGEEKKG